MTRIFVGNLPTNATETEVRSLFSRYGRVSSVDIKRDEASHRSRGFAFVVMPSFDEADEALFHLTGATIQGRSLTINEARKMPTSGTLAKSTERAAALQLFSDIMSDSDDDISAVPVNPN
jgi:RNA recognition motif-containing protein